MCYKCSKNISCLVVFRTKKNPQNLDCSHGAHCMSVGGRGTQSTLLHVGTQAPRWLHTVWVSGHSSGGDRWGLQAGSFLCGPISDTPHCCPTARAAGGLGSVWEHITRVVNPLFLPLIIMDLSMGREWQQAEAPSKILKDYEVILNQISKL